jgi:hypothetical protein
LGVKLLKLYNSGFLDKTTLDSKAYGNCVIGECFSVYEQFLVIKNFGFRKLSSTTLFGYKMGGIFGVVAK